MLRRISMTKDAAYLLAIVGGAMTGASVVLPYLWLLVCIGPSLFFFALLSAGDAKLRYPALLGLAFGMSLNAVAGLSSWSVYPLDWVGIPRSSLSLDIIGIFWIGSAMSMAIASAMFAAALDMIRKSVPDGPLLVIVAGILWVAAEWLQAVLSSIYMLGASTAPNAHFTLASAGNAFAYADSPFWYSLARWGGVPLLSFFAAAFGMSIALSVMRKGTLSLRIAMPVSIALLYAMLSLSAMHAASAARGIAYMWGDTAKITVVAIRGDYSPEFDLNPENTKRKTAIVYAVAQDLRARGISPDIVITPEGMGTLLPQDSYRELASLMATGTLVIHSLYPRDASGTHAAPETVFHTIGGGSNVTEKRFLIPYGEYPPYLFALFTKLFAPDTYSQILRNRSYPTGTREELGRFRNIPVGVRICAEAFSPGLFRDLARGYSAGLLVLTSSIGIFHHQPYLLWQMKAATRLRAVENGLPLVQAINGGEATAYDCTGREIAPILTTKDYKLYAIYRVQACPRH